MWSWIAVMALTLTVGVALTSGNWCKPMGPCRTCQFVSMERDRRDCNMYFLCHLGKMWQGFRCGPNQIYSTEYHGCIYSRDSDDEECRGALGVEPRAVTKSNPPSTTLSVSSTSTRSSFSTGPGYGTGTTSTRASFLSFYTPRDSSITDLMPEIPKWRPDELPLTDSCGMKMSRNIVGGREAGSTEWLWQVSLQYYNSSSHSFQHNCGGTLIHPSWVLTAAHCVYSKRHDRDIRRYLRVIVGEYRLDEPDPWEQRHRVSEITIHPAYLHYGSYPNDIALVKLRNPIKTTSPVRPICLPNEGSSPYRREPDVRTTGCWTTGWGYTLGTNDVDTLNEIKMEPVSHSVCSRAWPGYIIDTHVCARAQHARGVGACKGDSGGPLMCTRDGRFYVEGVVSWGEDTCLKKGVPNVFTQVSVYTGWIRRQMQQDDLFS